VTFHSKLVSGQTKPPSLAREKTIIWERAVGGGDLIRSHSGKERRKGGEKTCLPTKMSYSLRLFVLAGLSSVW